jgi:hypothetical protein
MHPVKRKGEDPHLNGMGGECTEYPENYPKTMLHIQARHQQCESI